MEDKKKEATRKKNEEQTREGRRTERTGKGVQPQRRDEALKKEPTNSRPGGWNL